MAWWDFKLFIGILGGIIVLFFVVAPVLFFCLKCVYEKGENVRYFKQFYDCCHFLMIEGKNQFQAKSICLRTFFLRAELKFLKDQLENLSLSMHNYLM